MDFYEKIMDLCKQKGVSRSKMADEIGISRSTPKEWDRKKSKPQFSTIKKLADYFEVPVDYLAEDQEVNTQSIKDNHGIIGHTHAPVTIINGSERTLTDQEMELLNIFESLGVMERAKLLVFAAELKEEK